MYSTYLNAVIAAYSEYDPILMKVRVKWGCLHSSVLHGIWSYRSTAVYVNRLNDANISFYDICGFLAQMEARDPSPRRRLLQYDTCFGTIQSWLLIGKVAL